LETLQLSKRLFLLPPPKYQDLEIGEIEELGEEYVWVFTFFTPWLEKVGYFIHDR